MPREFENAVEYQSISRAFAVNMSTAETAQPPPVVEDDQVLVPDDDADAEAVCTIGCFVAWSGANVRAG